MDKTIGRFEIVAFNDSDALRVCFIRNPHVKQRIEFYADDLPDLQHAINELKRHSRERMKRLRSMSK